MGGNQQYWWIIQVLQDSSNKVVTLKNSVWIRENARERKLRVCVEDCQILSREKFSEIQNVALYVQDGKIVQTLDYSKQAIIISSENIVFVYNPD